MNTKLINLLIIVLVILTSMTYAQQSNRWNIALKTSYLGDQSNSLHRLTAIEDPVSLGFQLRYFPRQEIALQFSNEYLNGKTRNNKGDELNIQASLSALFYPIQFERLSPYLIYGLVWNQHNSNSELKSDSDLNFQFGIGSDISITRSIFYSVNVKSYTNGWNFQGWGSSFSIGYRL
jgi:outer membrane protein W